MSNKSNMPNWTHLNYVILQLLDGRTHQCSAIRHCGRIGEVDTMLD